MMRSLSILLTAACAGLALFSSCKKSDSGTAPYGKLQVSLSNEAGGKPVELGPMNYVNAAGNPYSVDLLKYYVSNFTLVRADGSEHNFKDYHLIDAAVPASQSFSLDSVASGEYTMLRFYLGVDSARNHTGVQEGALDPIHGMIWDWNTGYIFFKHEGNFKDSTGSVMPMLFHFGSDKGLATVEIPLNQLRVEGDTRKLSLRFDLNALYSSPSVINFNYDNNRMSGNGQDIFWHMTLRGNFPNAFQLVKAE